MFLRWLFAVTVLSLTVHAACRLWEGAVGKSDSPVPNLAQFSLKNYSSEHPRKTNVCDLFLRTAACDWIVQGLGVGC